MLGQTPLPQGGVGKLAQGSFLRISRDKDGVGNAWKQSNKTAKQAFGTASTLGSLKQQVNRLRKRIPTLVQQLEPFYPFKIYQPSNVSQFTTGITFLDPSSGVGTVCNIDATKPTDFTATPPTVNPTTDAWRFWSVRSGQVEIRPIYNLLVPGAEYFSPTGDLIADPNNWGWKYTINTNADGVNPSASNMPFDSDSDSTLNPPLIINDNNAIDGGVSLLLWIQITPDTAGTLNTVQISGVQAYDPTNSSWPDFSPLSIPVGIISTVFFEEVTVPNVEQFIFDNQVNLFPKGSGSGTFFGAMNIRGAVYITVATNDYEFFPIDLNNQVYYPGDVFSFMYAVYNGSDPYTYASELYQYIYPPSFGNTLLAFYGKNQIPNPATGLFYNPSILKLMFNTMSLTPQMLNFTSPF